MTYTFGTAETLVLGVISLFIGIFVTSKWGVLKKYNIPVPVSGGLIVSILFGIFYGISDIEIKFTMELRNFLLLAFFATIGLSARIRMLISGGTLLLLLIVLAVIYLFIQNSVGVLLAQFVDIVPGIGLLAGSITMSGGHGTGLAYGEIFQSQYGVMNAMEVAMACATFGLIMGGLVGGPLAHLLVKRFNLKPDPKEQETFSDDHLHHESVVDMQGMLESIAIIGICIVVGTYFNTWFNTLGFESRLPDFVPVLFTGIIIANFIDFTKIYKTNQKSLELCSDLSLDLFLAMSLMSLQLWMLASLAMPLLFILVIQTVIALLFAYFIVFRVVGRNYTASVICAGYVGLGLGATPTAIANMSSVTQHYGLAPKAFLVIPLIGAFFIDIANALVIQYFLGLDIF